MPAKSETLEFVDAEDATALISPDGKLLVIEFNLGDDKSIRFGLSTEKARELLYRMSFVTAASLKDPTALGGPGFVRMTKVISADANVTDTEGGVALALTDDQHIPHYYVLDGETSARLRPQLRNAEASAKRGVKLGRA